MDGPCRSGNFFLSALPRTNLYLLVIEDWSEYRQSYFYNFNCHISNRVYDAGAFRIVNGTCAHIETQTSLKKKEKCPALKNVRMKCSYNVANSFRSPRLWELFSVTLILIVRNFSWIVVWFIFMEIFKKLFQWFSDHCTVFCNVLLVKTINHFPINDCRFFSRPYTSVWDGRRGTDNMICS